MRHKFKIGRVYHVRFLDHIKNQSIPLVCNVYGVAVDDREDSVAIAWWEVEHTDDDTIVENREILSIVKSTIKSKRLLDR